MKKVAVGILLCSFVCCLQWAGCKADPSFDIAPSARPVSFYVPEGWPEPVYSFGDNKLTLDGFELGRKLFYDPRLSRDNQISCGTCHQQFAAFANLDHPLSHGIEGRFGARNAQGLFNLNWHPDLFWDGSVDKLVHQPLRPITDPAEMDETITNIVSKLSSDRSYPAMFRNAFGSETISQERIFNALAQFMGTMISDHSRYDKYMRKEPGGNMTEQELNGLALFRQHCASCHKEPLFTDFSFRNNGLPPDPRLNDRGRATVTGAPEDEYKFKVPSLRNVGLTRPYMHDGRFGTLEAVLEHYRQGIHQAPGADPLMQGIILSAEQEADLIRFLHTLSDYEFIKDERFAENGT